MRYKKDILADIRAIRGKIRKHVKSMCSHCCCQECKLLLYRINKYQGYHVCRHVKRWEKEYLHLLAEGLKWQMAKDDN